VELCTVTLQVRHRAQGAYAAAHSQQQWYILAGCSAAVLFNRVLTWCFCVHCGNTAGWIWICVCVGMLRTAAGHLHWYTQTPCVQGYMLSLTCGCCCCCCCCNSCCCRCQSPF
jgi:hypothetical protein